MKPFSLEDRKFFAVTVRYVSGAYVARYWGFNASCTSGPEQAAERVIGKFLADAHPRRHWDLVAARPRWASPGAGNVFVTATAKGAA